MRHLPRNLIVSLLAMGSFSVIFAEDPAELETKKMAGIWSVKKLQIGGVEASADIRNKVKVTIEGNQMIVKGFDANDVRNVFTLHPTSKPATIDLEPTRKQAKSAKGSYEWGGNTLTLCVTDGEDRPKEFISKPNTEQVLMVLEKAQ